MTTQRRYVAVKPDGTLTLDMPVQSCAEGLRGLFAFAPPARKAVGFSAVEIQRLGFQKTGEALRAAMKKMSER